MKLRDWLIIFLVLSIPGIPLSIFLWMLVGLAALYIQKIPEKRLPLTEYWTGYPKSFYHWLSEFLLDWLRFTLILFLVLLIVIVTAVLGVARLTGNEPLDWILKILSVPVYVTSIELLALFYVSFFATCFVSKSNHWDTLFWQVEPAAKLLVGDEEYKKLTEVQKVEIKRYVVDAEIGINKGSWIVRGGKVHTINPPSGPLAKFGGPGILIVQTGHAVVLERRGNQFRIAGEGFHRLESFERPEMVVPLNTQTAKLKVKNVSTKDGAVIDEFDAYVFYKMEPGRRTRDTDSRYPFDENMIWTAWDTKGENPGDSVGPIASTAVRTIVSEHTLEELFVDHDLARDRLREELIRETNRITGPFIGICVIAAAIDNIVLPEPTKEKLWQIWATQRDRDIMRQKSDAEAYAVDTLEKAKNRARKDLIDQIRQGLNTPPGALPPGLAKALMRLVEELTKQPISEDIVAKQQLEVMKEIIQSDATKNVYVGSPMLGRTRTD